MELPFPIMERTGFGGALLNKVSLRCLLDVSVEIRSNSLHITHCNAHLEFRDKVQAEELHLELISKYVILIAVRLPENTWWGA